MTKHTFYFDHDYNARNDQKILELRAEYGWHGYGVYFALIEVLCESDNCIKRVALGGLSLGFNLPKGDVEKLLDFMVEIGLLEEKGGIISSKRVDKHLSYRTLLSEAGKRGGRGNKKPTKSQAKATPEAGKERKGEESKVYSNIKEGDNAPPVNENYITSFDKASKILSGQIWQEVTCMNMGFDPIAFKKFSQKWIKRKESTGDTMYTIVKLKKFMVDDFEKELKQLKADAPRTKNIPAISK